ncbi:unnamed protein product [Rodentolepis nana]|uniref:ANK_REP_REGION domain-containing protein n=1 Tax=Rodentolepis nana TaxID=102285 RepID=A0A0R3TWE9_RODNA|nr:unnamed protein product [Rodentolepis nana]
MKDWNLLCSTIRENNYEGLKNLLWKIACPNIKNERCWTSLHIAALLNRTKCIKILMARGASINAKTIDGKIPGHLAALHGNVESLNLLLENKTDICAADNRGWTMLHKAAYHGHIRCCEILIDHLADPLAKTSSGETPLHLAAREGHIEVVKFLLSLNKNWLTQLGMRTDFGETPKDLAKKFHKSAVVGIIDNLEWGKELEPNTHPSHSPSWERDIDRISEPIRTCVIDMNSKNEKGDVPLHKERIVLLDDQLRLEKAEYFRRGGKEIELIKSGIQPERDHSNLMAEIQYERILREELEIQLNALMKRQSVETKT